MIFEERWIIESENSLEHIWYGSSDYKKRSSEEMRWYDLRWVKMISDELRWSQMNKVDVSTVTKNEPFSFVYVWCLKDM